MQLAVVHLAQHEESLLLSHRVGSQLGLAGVDILQVIPARQAQEQSHQVVQRRLIAVIKRQNLPVRLDGLVGVVEHFLPDLGRTRAQLLLVRQGFDHLHLALEQQHELTVVGRADIDGFQRVGRF